MSAFLFVFAIIVTNLVCYAGSFLSATWLIAPFMFKEIPSQPWQVHVLKLVMFIVVQIICSKVSKASLAILTIYNTTKKES